MKECILIGFEKMMQLEGNVVENKESQILKMDKTYCSVNLNGLNLKVLIYKVGLRRFTLGV